MAPVQETFTEALEFTSEFTAHAWPNLMKHFDPVWVEEAVMARSRPGCRRSPIACGNFCCHRGARRVRFRGR